MLSCVVFWWCVAVMNTWCRAVSCVLVWCVVRRMMTSLCVLPTTVRSCDPHLFRGGCHHHYQVVKPSGETLPYTFSLPCIHYQTLLLATEQRVGSVLFITPARGLLLRLHNSHSDIDLPTLVQAHDYSQTRTNSPARTLAFPGDGSARRCLPRLRLGHSPQPH